MLSLKPYISCLIFGLAFVISTNANAGLYGFSETGEQFSAEHLSVPPRHISNYRKEMRDLIVALAQYGKSRNPNFQVLVHEGQYLLDKSLWEYHLDAYNKIRRTQKNVQDISFLKKDVSELEEQKHLSLTYTDIIDGIVVNSLYCQKRSHELLDKSNLPIVSIEHCPDEKSIDDAITSSFLEKRLIYPFIDPQYAFRHIYHQLIINETADGILTTKQAKNISFLIDDEKFSNPYQMLDEIRQSNYDIVVIHPVFHNTIPFSKEDVHAMKFKKNGARRLIFALYNVSELSEKNYLWQKKWSQTLPNWLIAKSLVSENSYIAQYWRPEWKKIVSHYFKSIVDSGYDGVFLTGLENHEYFEHNKPLE